AVNPKEQHVPEEVEEARVEEHRGDEGRERRRVGTESPAEDEEVVRREVRVELLEAGAAERLRHDEEVLAEQRVVRRGPDLGERQGDEEIDQHVDEDQEL